MLNLFKYSAQVVLLFLYLCLFPISMSLAQTYASPSVNLIVKIDGKEIHEKDLVNISSSQPIQLSVGIRRLSGDIQDVTQSNKIKYRSSSPWNLTVDKAGLVKAKYHNQEIPENRLINKGMITVAYGILGEHEIGFRLINFAVANDKGFYSSDEANAEILTPQSTEDISDNGQKQEENISESKTDELNSFKELFGGSLDDPSVLSDKVPSSEDNSLDVENNSDNQIKDDKSKSQADFIDYDALKKAAASSVKKSSTSTNNQIQMTDEERRLYNEALGQP